MTRRNPSRELTEHLRREFVQMLQSQIATAEARAASDLDPQRRDAHKTHAEAMRRALQTYRKAWGRLEGGGVREGNR